jgi:D-alanyl-lipoteichoic acid acyltransferase DltB (MBOAT superfamily)
MTFISYGYLFVFLPLIVALYHLFRRTRLANVAILLFSYFFYAVGGAWFLIPLMITSLIDFWVGQKLDEVKAQRIRKLLLIVSLVANLGLLAFFKYTPWLIDSINHGLKGAGLAVLLPTFAIALPPGISFYTFQTMSYTIEVYWREMKSSLNVIDYMAFVTFWPHLVAGPIMRARTLLTQLEKVRPVVSIEDARYALMLIVWGVTKKIVLADNFGWIVDSIDGHVKGGFAWPGAGLLFAYAFAGQIYCDFSAYTDIARGSAKLVGVELVRNFRTPYYAVSPTDFWRRWHISLSSWLRDYLYIPLGGNRFGRFFEFRNLMITMLLGGLWHGAGILFIVWGFWHGCLLILYRLVPLDHILKKYFGTVGVAVSIFLMFHLVVFGWILFRADVSTILPLLKSIGALATSSDQHVLFLAVGRGVLALTVVVLITDLLGYLRDVEFVELLARVNPYIASAIAVICYLAITMLGKRESTQFIYFQF